jgi:5-methylcytosine-specific restriction endonuclease McrA
MSRAPFTAERNAKISAALTGRHHSEATKAKLSAYWKGKPRGPMSPATKAKLSAAKREAFKTRPMRPKRVIGICVYCGGPATSMDHVIPRCRGGSDDPTNLVPACQSCNASKRELTPDEWRANVAHAPQNPLGRGLSIQLQLKLSTLPCSARTHCPAGHPYAGENVITTSKGHRECRTCKRSRGRRSYAENPELFRERQRQMRIRRLA